MKTLIETRYINSNRTFGNLYRFIPKKQKLIFIDICNNKYEFHRKCWLLRSLMQNNTEYTIPFVEVLQNGQNQVKYLGYLLVFKTWENEGQILGSREGSYWKWNDGISEMLTVCHLSSVGHMSGYCVINEWLGLCV